MAERGDGLDESAWEWRKRALKAAGVVGMWERDHRGGTTRYCPGAAELLAGDAGSAWRDLSPEEALSGIHPADAERLRERMSDGTSSLEARSDGCEVRTRGGEIRRILCRGRSDHDADGAVTYTRGIVLDVTQPGADGGSVLAALDAAAEHALATHDAIRVSGVRALLAPARALLLAVGREISRRL